MSHIVKDNVYMIGRPGFIYTAPWIMSRNTRPPSAAILLSTASEPFTLIIRGKRLTTQAAVVPPFVPRSLYARNVPLVCFHVTPSSEYYHSLSHLTKGNVVVLDRGLFRGFDSELTLLYRGQLPPAHALDIYDAVVQRPIQHLPIGSSSDPRADRIRQLLQAEPTLTLTQLAKELGVSYFWTSRLMADVFGVSLRDYKGWRKQEYVFDFLHSNRSITDIAHAAGFTDSAHLARTYQRWFGQPPSYSRNPNHVRILRCAPPVSLS